MLYESIFQSLKYNYENNTFLSSIGASTITALTTTLLSYPLDLAHGRMAADMSKKIPISLQKGTPLA